MTQSQLNRAVAHSTGESCDTIAALGFSLLEELPDDSAVDQLPAYCLDCPGCGAAVVLTHGSLDSLPELAECDQCDLAYPFIPHEVYDSALAVCG